MPIRFIQTWYQSQCNGAWERSNGITIESLGSPGWLVTVDLTDTPLERESMETIRRERSDTDWLVCEVSHQQFRGQGDSKKLLDILSIFHDWARTKPPPP